MTATQKIPAPDPSWQWYIDKGSQQLAIELGQIGQLVMPIASKQLLQQNLDGAAFSIQDTHLYHQWLERIEASPLVWTSEATMCLLLNVVACLQYQKEQSGKAWYFKKPAQPFNCELGTIALLKTDLSESHALVIEQKSDFVNVALLQPLQLTESKAYATFAAIKVGADCLHQPDIEG